MIAVSDFDDFINKENASEDSTPVPEAQKAAHSLLEMLSGNEDIASLNRKFNLDPDMSEKVIVPLLNFLDKYGVGDAVGGSDTAQNALGVFEFWNDIAPVLKNAAEYFGGKKEALTQEDIEFLERIKDSQNSGDMSLFIGDELEEDGSVVVEPETPEEVSTPEGQIPIDRNVFAEGVNWGEVLGSPVKEPINQYYGTYTDAMPDTEFMVAGLEQLAEEQGLQLSEVMQGDMQNRINQGGDTRHSGPDYTDDAQVSSLNLGEDEISNAMAQQMSSYRRESRLKWDESGLPTPDSISEYDPLTVEGYEKHSPIKGLESVEDLAHKSGISLDNSIVVEDIEVEKDRRVLEPVENVVLKPVENHHEFGAIDLYEIGESSLEEPEESEDSSESDSDSDGEE